MQLDLSIVHVRERHPGVVEQLLVQLAASTSKERFRPDPVAAMRFFYGWSFQLGGPDFVGAPTPEAVAQWLSPRISWCIGAKLGRWRGRVQGTTPIPPEIVEGHRVALEAQQRERARIAALTPAQRQAELRKLLGDLAGTPGLVMIAKKP